MLGWVKHLLRTEPMFSLLPVQTFKDSPGLTISDLKGLSGNYLVVLLGLEE